jgi:D-threo-aldose 1-dehydrogenase
VEPAARPTQGWGLGVNRIGPVELLLGLSEVKPDGTLPDHERALERLMPATVDPYSSGKYQKASPEIVAKVERIKAVAQRHDVHTKPDTLQFSLAHLTSAAVIPGASRPERIAEDHAALKAVIPADFWREMRKPELVAANAPLPIDQ